MVVVVEEEDEEARLLDRGLGGVPSGRELLGYAEGVPGEDVPGARETSLRVRATQARDEARSARVPWRGEEALRVGWGLSDGRGFLFPAGEPWIRRSEGWRGAGKPVGCNRRTATGAGVGGGTGLSGGWWVGGRHRGCEGTREEVERLEGGECRDTHTPPLLRPRRREWLEWRYSSLGHRTSRMMAARCSMTAMAVSLPTALASSQFYVVVDRQCRHNEDDAAPFGWHHVIGRPMASIRCPRGGDQLHALGTATLESRDGYLQVVHPRFLHLVGHHHS